MAATAPITFKVGATATAFINAGIAVVGATIQAGLFAALLGPPGKEGIYLISTGILNTILALTTGSNPVIVFNLRRKQP